jgi:hypothetical protein
VEVEEQQAVEAILLDVAMVFKAVDPEELDYKLA